MAAIGHVRVEGHEEQRIPVIGGGSARISTKRDFYPDGREFIGRGVQPDIEVKPTVEAFLNDRDEVLERAVAELKRKAAEQERPATRKESWRSLPGWRAAVSPTSAPGSSAWHLINLLKRPDLCRPGPGLAFTHHPRESPRYLLSPSEFGLRLAPGPVPWWLRARDSASGPPGLGRALCRPGR